MPRITAAITLAILVISSLVVTFSPVNAATVLPPGFVSEAVVTNLTGPTTIAFAPDGRMFIGQKDGRVRVFQNGVLLPTDFINISAQVNDYWDRGLLGIAIHPDFPNTPYVYLLYTYDPPGTTNNGGGARVSRLIRVTANPANTNVALAGSEVVLLGTNSTFANIGDPNSNDPPAESCKSGSVYVQDCIAADSVTHTIGTVTFGTDGSLFVSSGDGAHFTYTDVRALRALNVDSLNGKILRIDPITGQGYSDNPFYNGNLNSNRSKVYSLGLRNPFRTTVNPSTGELFIGDVGWNSWEELNTGRGKNFGWPCYEGNNGASAQQGSYKNNAATSATCAALYAQGLGAVQAPLYAYDHSAGSSSIQAGGFYQGTVYPPQYQGALFFSDYSGDWIRYRTSAGTVTTFGTDVASGVNGGIVQLLVGPDTNLYYVAYFGPSPNASEVRRIRYTAGGNTPPTANASADPASGYVPLTVNFSSDGSFDPDVQTLTYAWNFGDGTTGTGPNPSHIYLTSGNFIATLTITDSAGDTGSDTVNVTIGNLKPVATIIAPANGLAYGTGDTITYNGTGIDNEDGNLSGANLQWDILLHHNQHVHFDFLPGLIGNTGSFTVPDHGDNTWIELCLTVTDSGGLIDQDCVSLQPKTVTISFDTVPSGLELEYEGVAYTTPVSVVTNVNAVRDLIAPTTQQVCHNFVSWSDGGAASHQVTIGATPQTYIATYTPCPITVTVSPNQSKTYGAANPALIYTSSNAAATFTGALNRALGENVGVYAIGQGTLAVTGNKYTIASFVPANFTINPKAASVTPNAANKIYGSIDPALTGALNGFLPADNVTATYSRALGETVAGGPYTISATLNPAGVLANYNITYNTASFTINRKLASVTPNAINKNYGSADPILTGTLNGFVTADNVTATYSRTPGETVAGSPYTISAILSPAGVLGNYTVTFDTANFTITQASSTVSLSNLNYVYDGTPKTVTATTNPPGLPVNITYNGSPNAPTDAGSYAVVATVNHPNYIGVTNNTLLIAKAVVNPGITVDNKVYDGTVAATIATRNLTGIFFGDVVNLSGGTAAFANKNAGNNKNVTAAGLAIFGADVGNYQIASTSVDTTANITPRTLTISATGVDKGYDGTTAATVTLSDDRVTGDTITANYTTASFLDPNVGTAKTVNVSGLSISDADAGNYTLSNTTAITTANIGIASQTINVLQPAPAMASEGTDFIVIATASSQLPVAVTTSGACIVSNNNPVTITMNSSSGTCSIFYNQAGNVNYTSAVQAQNDVTVRQKPGITSSDNITFNLGFSDTFTITTTGDPTLLTVISVDGALPPGVTFIDNGDGTATLSGTPTASGIFPLSITANNGVLPNAVQSFTLIVRNGPIIGAKGVSSVPDTGNGSISENEIIRDTLGITQITVEFSQDVFDDPIDDPTSPTYAKDVTNPANYILVLGSSAGKFQTVSCSAGVTEPDIAISVDSVAYDNNEGAGPFIATLNVNGGNPLNVTGFYRLYVCGTTSIVDAANINLKLAGNGVTPGTDFLRNFRIQTRIASGSGNSSTARNAVTNGLLIPVTGFDPNQVVSLPIQPVDKAYKSLGKISIEIPTLGINYPIVGANISKNGWDLTWLKDSVAYLEGSAYPTLAGNTVLTAHVLDANNNLGPFSDIKGMQSGEKIYIHANGQVYVYQVQENKKVMANDISTVFKHEEYSWITLVTCEDFSGKTGLYTHRRLIRAVLTSVIPEK